MQQPLPLGSKSYVLKKLRSAVLLVQPLPAPVHLGAPRKALGGPTLLVGVSVSPRPRSLGAPSARLIYSGLLAGGACRRLPRIAQDVYLSD